MSKNISLTQLGYIVAVNKYRHFAMAAEKSCISQPTLSVQIQKAEDELGITIFDRKKQPVVPTDLGKAIIDQAQLILQNFDRLEEIVKNKKGLIEGEFRLGIIPTVASSLIPLFLKKFSSKYPKVKIIIDELQTDALLECLLTDRLDAGIASTPLGHEEIKEQLLYYEAFKLYVSPKHPLNKLKSVSPKDLSEQNLWLMKDGHCFRNQVSQLCSLKGNLNNQGQVNFESGSFQTLMRLVGQNYGLTILPQLTTLFMNSKEKRTMVRNFKSPEPMREISFLSRRSLVKEAIAKALIKEISDSLPKELKITPKKSQTLDPLFEQ